MDDPDTLAGLDEAIFTDEWTMPDDWRLPETAYAENWPQKPGAAYAKDLDELLGETPPRPAVAPKGVRPSAWR